MDAVLRYQQERIMTTPKEELTLMLYDGCIRFIKAAILAMDDKQYEKVNENIIKAENIITELMSTLDMKYEISNNLYNLYDFVYRWLIQANIKKDKKYLDEVLPIVQDLRDTWSEAIKLARNKK